MDAVTGIITTVAGGGISVPGDGGLATNARLGMPVGLAVDAAGNFYFGDAFHHRVRRVDRVTGIITTVRLPAK